MTGRFYADNSTCQLAGGRCWIYGRSADGMSSWRQRLYACQPTTLELERVQDTLGSRQQLENINVADVQFMSANSRPLSSVRNLGVDSWLSMAEQWASHDHLPGVLLSAASAAQRCAVVDTRGSQDTIHAFISCRIDNCNALPHGIADNQFQRLQSAIWAYHAGPALIALVTRPSASHSRAGNACPQVHEWPGPDVPGWLLSTDWRPSLRNEISRDLELHVPRAYPHTATDHLLSQGQVSIIWNNLLPVLQDRSLSSQGFRRLLKTNLLGRRSTALVHSNWRLRNVLTYLLTYNCYNGWCWLRNSVETTRFVPNVPFFVF